MAKISAGTEAQLQAQANDLHGEPVGGAALVYESAAPGVLYVSQTGVVHSLGRLTDDAGILVRSGAISARVRVRVEPGEVQRLERVGEEPVQLVAGVPANDSVWARRRRLRQSSRRLGAGTARRRIAAAHHGLSHWRGRRGSGSTL